MRIALAALLSFVAIATHAAQAFGQIHGTSQTEPASGISDVGLDANDWDRCAGLDYHQAPRGIRSCGRIISDRVSRTHTAAALLFRGKYLEASGSMERATADYRAAERLFGQIIGAEPNDASAYNNHASALRRLGRPTDAVLEIGRAIEIAQADLQTVTIRNHPDSEDIEGATHMLADYRYNRGMLFFDTHDYARAAADFDEAARLWPEASIFQGARCEARAAAHVDLEQAATACEAAIHLAADDQSRLAHALFSRGYLNFMRGNFDAAWSDFSAALEHSDDCEHAWYGRGVLAKRRGRTEDGDASIARAMEIDPFDVATYAGTGLAP